MLLMNIGEANPVDQTLSSEILSVFECMGEEATLGDLVHSVQHKGFGFLFVILSIPAVLPGTSGIATPFGILSLLLAAQIWIGRDEPWFPPKVLRRKVGGMMRKFLTAMAQTLRKFEQKLKPRFQKFYAPKMFRFIIAPLLLVCSIMVAIPLPGTNSVAGLAIFLIGLGMLEEDGLFGIAGSVIATAGLILGAVSIYFISVYGWSGLERLKLKLTGR